jgi:hypothetical protein
MKIELSINDDKELRDCVKDMIKGQVKNIIREELDKIIADIHLHKIGKESIEHSIQQSIKEITYGYANRYTDDWDLKKEVREAIDKRINEYFEKEDIAKKIQDRLNSAVIKLDVDIESTGVGKPQQLKI